MPLLSWDEVKDACFKIMYLRKQKSSSESVSENHNFNVFYLKHITILIQINDKI